MIKTRRGKRKSLSQDKSHLRMSLRMMYERLIVQIIAIIIIEKCGGGHENDIESQFFMTVIGSLSIFFVSSHIFRDYRKKGDVEKF